MIEGKTQIIEVAGNLAAVISSDDEPLTIAFTALRENRLAFIVQLKDPKSDPQGHVIFHQERRSNLMPDLIPVPPICVLDVGLPQSIQDERTLSSTAIEDLKGLDLIKSLRDATG